MAPSVHWPSRRCSSPPAAASYATHACDSTSRSIDRFTSIPRYQTGEVANADVLAQQAHRSVAEREIRRARMKRIRLAAPFAAVIRMGKRCAAKIIAVGAIQCARPGNCQTVVARSIDAKIGARPNPPAAIHAIARQIADPRILAIQDWPTRRLRVQNRVRQTVSHLGQSWLRVLRQNPRSRIID